MNTRVAWLPRSLRRTDSAISFKGTECGLPFLSEEKLRKRTFTGTSFVLRAGDL